MAAQGTATLDFGTTPTDESSVLVSGLSGLTVSSHMEAFMQGGDSTVDNDQLAHRLLAMSGRFSCEYVSASSMRIYCDLTIAAANGTFVVHWATA